jgi:hypothetical protein
MTMVTETREVIEEREEYCSTSVTTTSTTMTFIKQNGTNSISVEDNVLRNGSASVKNVYLNGPAHEDQTCAIGSNEPEVTKSCMQPPTSTENTRFLNGKCYHKNKVYWHTQLGGELLVLSPSPPIKAKFKETQIL